MHGVFTREGRASAPDSRAEGEAARQVGVSGASKPGLSSALNVLGLKTLCPGQQDAGQRKEPVSFVMSSGSLYMERQRSVKVNTVGMKHTPTQIQTQ